MKKHLTFFSTFSRSFVFPTIKLDLRHTYTAPDLMDDRVHMLKRIQTYELHQINREITSGTLQKTNPALLSRNRSQVNKDYL